MHCDNSKAIQIAIEPKVQKRSRHIFWKFHSIRDVVERGEINILKVHTDLNIVDPFTKPMTIAKHYEHARNIRLRLDKSLFDV